MTYRLVFFGPPGSGKGTQAKILAQRLGIPAISTGEIFRSNVAAGTPLGVEAQKYIDQGDYVPDSVTDPLVQHRLAESDCNDGFILDGYPRTVLQAEVLEKYLADHGKTVSAVIDIEVDSDETIERMLHRAEEQGRADDTEPVIRHRVDVYHQATAPVAAWYGQRKLLHTVDGAGSVDNVSARIWQVIENIQA